MNQLIKISTNEIKTMSSREIAELTGKNHADVMRDIRNLQEELVQSNFALYCQESNYLASNGKTNPMYVLDKESTLTLISGYSAQLRMAIIKRWQELELNSQYKVPTTFREALLLAVEQQDLIEHQQALLIQQKPKVDFADRVASSSDLIDIGTFAKLVYDEIGLGRNRLFNLLRSNGILMKNNNPYQAYIDNGTFKVIEGTVTTPYGTKITTKTLLTGEGQIKLLERLRKLEE